MLFAYGSHVGTSGLGNVYAGDGGSSVYALGASVCPLRQAHPVGCIDALSLYVRNAAKWLSLVAFVFACVAMLGGFVVCAAGYGMKAAAEANRRRQSIGGALASAPPPPPTTMQMRGANTAGFSLV